MTMFLVQHYLDSAAGLFPNRTATTCGQSRLDYSNLFESSNRLANCLLQNGIDRQDRVACYLSRSVASIVSIAGILKADAIYVPIDPKSPGDRAATILNDCQPKAIVCDKGSVRKAIQLLPDLSFSPKVIVMGDLSSEEEASPDLNVISGLEIETEPSECPAYRNVDTDMAYILYTSGSTGRPKGVMISHLNIINYIEWAVECFGITHEDRILNTAPFHFDMSTFDIFCALRSGAALCIAQDMTLLFPGKLLELIDKEQITLWKGISSLLMYVTRTVKLESGRLPTLKKILFSGEVLPTKYLIEWMKAFPDKMFYNVYGPTEATGISTYYLIDKIPESPAERVPIGRACSNVEVFVLREDNRACEVDEPGELCIRGSGLARGYWNDRVKTENAFVPNHLSQIPGDRFYRTGDLAAVRKDGELEYLGRKDDQIKWMGYRIELAEIVSALLSTENIKDAAALLCRGSFLDQEELVAFVEAGKDEIPTEIMSSLSLRLPPYMLPKRIIPVERIPRTDRGKVDKHRLNEYFSQTSP